MRSRILKSFSALIVVGFGAIMYGLFNDPPEECLDIPVEPWYEDTVGVYDSISLDEAVKDYRALSKKEGGKPIRGVWHYSQTDTLATAKDIVRIGQQRFGESSYAAIIKYNGQVVWLNSIAEHTPSVGGMNSIALSFCFVGDYRYYKPTYAQMKAACILKASLERYSEENPDFQIEYFSAHKYHKATICPTENVMEMLLECNLITNPKILNDYSTNRQEESI